MPPELDDAAYDASLVQSGELDLSTFVKRHGHKVVRRLLGRGLGAYVDIAHGIYRGSQRGNTATLDRSRYFNAPGQLAFREFIETADYGIFLIIGAPGMAKTTLMGAMAQRWRSQPQIKRQYIVLDRGPVTPAWRKVLAGTPWLPFEFSKANIEAIPKQSALFIQDAGRVLDSRDFGNDVEAAFSLLEEITRHRGVPIVGDVQNTSILSKRAFMSACRAIAYKPLGQTGIEMEREALRYMARKAQLAFEEQIPVTMEPGTCKQDSPPCGWRHYAFWYCDEVKVNGKGFEGFVHSVRPDWYSLELSKFHGYQDEPDDDPDIIDGDYSEP
ncbi:MAG: hypothetical protein KGL39_49095 [Patescibacteria group bacterium]|nr:hypothetical protein [Patescibacteria group bacterium]